jgi:4'-phosphopantetheinyl transferase
MIQARSMNMPFTLSMQPDSAHARAGILVWLVEFTAWRPRLSSLRACLDPSQRERAARLRDPALRRDRELAYALHRVALADLLGLPASCVPLQRSAEGQPRLPGGKVHTSLSHASTHAAIAISTAGPVGVDIEPTRRNFSLAELADRICHPDELEAIGETGLLRLWVRKEAMLKAIGTGLAIEMSSFAAPDEGLVALRSSASASAMSLQVRQLDAGAECVAAVAGMPGASIDCQWLVPDDESWRGQPIGAAPALEPIRI